MFVSFLELPVTFIYIVVDSNPIFILVFDIQVH